MRSILPLLMFFPAAAFGQTTATEPNAGENLSIVVGHNTYGYVNGVRLDSINATYARFDHRSGAGLLFDYGQIWNKRKELNVTDKSGKMLAFNAETDMVRLNFFWFNGWQLHKALTDSSGRAVSYILMKKQKGAVGGNAGVFLGP